MSQLLKIEFEWGQKFDAAQQSILRDHSVTDVAFEEDGRLRYGSPAAVVTNAFFVAMPGIKATVVGVVDNASTKALSEFGARHTTVVNERCSVSVAGLGLLTIQQVKVAIDMCSDRLQEDLLAGWRIVAVCVQPDQRRPDYVLGRTDAP